jgi:hypothetical protein
MKEEIKPMRLKLYAHILRIGTVTVRNLLAAPKLDESRQHAASCLSEFLHHIPPLLLIDSAGGGDVYFLEKAARRFLNDYPFKNEAAFLELCDLTLELCALARPGTPVELQLPEDLLASIQRHRHLNQRDK